MYSSEINIHLASIFLSCLFLIFSVWTFCLTVFPLSLECCSLSAWFHLDLLLSCGSESISVLQVHFTGWPAEGARWAVMKQAAFEQGFLGSDLEEEMCCTHQQWWWGTGSEPMEKQGFCWTAKELAPPAEPCGSGLSGVLCGSWILAVCSSFRRDPVSEVTRWACQPLAGPLTRKWTGSAGSWGTAIKALTHDQNTRRLSAWAQTHLSLPVTLSLSPGGGGITSRFRSRSGPEVLQSLQWHHNYRGAPPWLTATGFMVLSHTETGPSSITRVWRSPGGEEKNGPEQVLDPNHWNQNRSCPVFTWCRTSTHCQWKWDPFFPSELLDRVSEPHRTFNKSIFTKNRLKDNNKVLMRTEIVKSKEEHFDWFSKILKI